MSDCCRMWGREHEEGGPVNEWTFRLDLVGLDVDGDARLDALYEAGCHDATFATDAGGIAQLVRVNAVPAASPHRSIAAVPAARYSAGPRCKRG